MERSSGFDVLGGLVIGGLLGFVAGLLLAPEPGQRTREKLSGQLADLRDNSEDLLGTARTTFGDKLGRLGEAFEAGRKAAETKREEIINEAENPDA
jgi:gas vesicle protein